MLDRIRTAGGVLLTDTTRVEIAGFAAPALVQVSLKV